MQKMLAKIDRDLLYLTGVIVLALVIWKVVV